MSSSGSDLTETIRWEQWKKKQGSPIQPQWWQMSWAALPSGEGGLVSSLVQEPHVGRLEFLFRQHRPLLE